MQSILCNYVMPILCNQCNVYAKDIHTMLKRYTKYVPKIHENLCMKILCMKLLNKGTLIFLVPASKHFIFWYSIFWYQHQNISCFEHQNISCFDAVLLVIKWCLLGWIMIIRHNIWYIDVNIHLRIYMLHYNLHI